MYGSNKGYYPGGLCPHQPTKTKETEMETKYSLAQLLQLNLEQGFALMCAAGHAKGENLISQDPSGEVAVKLGLAVLAGESVPLAEVEELADVVRAYKLHQMESCDAILNTLEAIVTE